MKPGPELDALVAEKVMGWKRCTVEGHCGGLSMGQMDAHYHVENGVTVIVVPKMYSTDIASAWPLAEKLGLCVVPLYQTWGELPDAIAEPKQIGWAAGPGYWNGEDYMEQRTGAWQKGETAQHAICLAALKSVGVTIYR